MENERVQKTITPLTPLRLPVAQPDSADAMAAYPAQQLQQMVGNRMAGRLIQARFGAASPIRPFGGGIQAGTASCALRAREGRPTALQACPNGSGVNRPGVQRV